MSRADLQNVEHKGKINTYIFFTASTSCNNQSSSAIPDGYVTRKDLDGLVSNVQCLYKLFFSVRKRIINFVF